MHHIYVNRVLCTINVYEYIVYKFTYLNVHLSTDTFISTFVYLISQSESKITVQFVIQQSNLTNLITENLDSIFIRYVDTVVIILYRDYASCRN